MHRRAFLVTTAATLTAGCIGSNPDPTPTPTPRPEVLLVNLVNDWQSSGDVEAEARGYTYRGDRATIAYRVRVPVHDGTVHTFEQVDVRHVESGERVVRRQFETEELVDSEGTDVYEAGVNVDTSGWALGEYRVSVTVRDEVTGSASAPGTVVFELRR